MANKVAESPVCRFGPPEAVPTIEHQISIWPFQPVSSFAGQRFRYSLLPARILAVALRNLRNLPQDDASFGASKTVHLEVRRSALLEL